MIKNFGQMLTEHKDDRKGQRPETRFGRKEVGCGDECSFLSDDEREGAISYYQLSVKHEKSTTIAKKKILLQT